MKTLKKALQVFLQYFLRGVFLFLPALATGYVIWLILRWLDSLLPVRLPGMGIFLLCLGIAALGYVGTHWLGPTIVASLEERIRRIPFIGFIYSSVRELVESSRQGLRFDKPVLVQVGLEPPLYRIGFLTHERPLPDQPLVAVYMPYSFGFMGDLWLLPSSCVQPLKLSAAEALRFVLAGGLVRPSKSVSAFPA
ncbi:MAG: DUF502 domain-containing protein [Bacteroidia bacterium]|nr:DUF502 domain-containing protein [Bacteroidia bacterium]